MEKWGNIIVFLSAFIFMLYSCEVNIDDRVSEKKYKEDLSQLVEKNMLQEDERVTIQNYIEDHVKNNKPIYGTYNDIKLAILDEERKRKEDEEKIRKAEEMKQAEEEKRKAEERKKVEEFNSFAQNLVGVYKSSYSQQMGNWRISEFSDLEIGRGANNEFIYTQKRTIVDEYNGNVPSTESFSGTIKAVYRDGYSFPYWTFEGGDYGRHSAYFIIPDKNDITSIRVWIPAIGYVPKGRSSEVSRDYIKNAQYDNKIKKQLVDNESDNFNTSDVGYYITSGKDDSRAYFYSEPNIISIKKSYLYKGDEVFVQKSKNRFGFVIFTNTKGQVSTGWVELSELIRK